MEPAPLKDTLTQRLFGPEIKKFDRKRLTILEAFARSLYERGLADTSYASVAEILDMKPAHVAYYFASWESMLEGAFQLAIHTAQELTVQGVAKGKTPKDRLRAMVSAPFEHFHRFPHHKAVLAAYHLECVRAPKFRKAQRQVREMGNERLQQLLIQLKHPKTSAAKLAAGVQHMIAGYCSEWIALGEPDPWEEAVKRTFADIERFLQRKSP